MSLGTQLYAISTDGMISRCDFRDAKFLSLNRMDSLLGNTIAIPQFWLSELYVKNSTVMIQSMSLENDNKQHYHSRAIAKADMNDASSITRLPIDRKKRDVLRKVVKANSKCEHSSIYSQISFICRRLATSHEENRISTEQAMHLILKAHEELSHKGLPKEVVAEELHKVLDKLEGNSRSLFGIVMANTNSSVHIQGKPIEFSDENKEQADVAPDKYSENYWADVI
jgi:hypothetical protein